MGTALGTREAGMHWRSVDAPHAAEAYAGDDYSTPRTSIMAVRPDIPRGSAGMVCCGVQWENRADVDAHRMCVHL